MNIIQQFKEQQTSIIVSWAKKVTKEEAVV